MKPQWEAFQKEVVVLSYYICRQRYFSKENRFWNTQSDPKFGRRGGSVSHIDARKKGFRNTVPACTLVRKNFWNGVLARSITRIPLLASVF
jgi:hypothetical protein